jgi:asparagine synthase (glutamine-hydrolysing)
MLDEAVNDVYAFSICTLLPRKRLKNGSTHSLIRRERFIRLVFFKTGKGEYGEGDQFLGITVPLVRAEVKRWGILPLETLERLVASPWHEIRLFGWIALVKRFEAGDAEEKERCRAWLVAQVSHLNNWDFVDVTVPRDAVERFYAVGYVGGALTMYEGVDSLEPGVLWKVASQGGCVRVDAFGHVTEVFSGLADPASAAPVLQETVRHAVQRHLVSDRPVGIFLSGGLDSSVVLAAMREARGAETIKSFTTRFRHRTNDAKFNIDAELAKKTAAHFGCEHTEIEVTGEEVAAEAEKMAFHLGQPHGNYAIVAQNAAAARAKQAVAVVLTGDGGDELFGGYERYKAWRRFSLGERIPGALPLARAASGLRVAWRERWGDLLQAPDEAARWLTFHATPRAVRASYLSFPGGITDASALALWRETLASVTTTDPVARCLALDRLTWLRDDAFVRSDRLAMRHGLEARLPLVDDALFALATAVPTAWHVDAFRTKKWWRENPDSISIL